MVSGYYETLRRARELEPSCVWAVDGSRRHRLVKIDEDDRGVCVLEIPECSVSQG